MSSRLRKAINHQRREAFKKYKEATKIQDPEVCEDSIEPAQKRNLPFPKILYTNQPYNPVLNSPTTPTLTSTSHNSILTPSKNSHSDWKMMDEHRLWVRVFNKYDRLLFNHTNYTQMLISQMIYLCTKLVNHLNSISQTDELKVQKALGTLEGTITAQLIPLFDGITQYHSWEAREPEENVYYDIGAITIIKQNNDGIFEGQLIDDYINTTFQLL